VKGVTRYFAPKAAYYGGGKSVRAFQPIPAQEELEVEMSRSLIALALAGVIAFAAGCSDQREDVARATRENRAKLPQAAATAEETVPLEAGDRVPSATVTDMDGQAVELSPLVAAKPTVIIFYRGGWCPYCTTHLGALATIEPRLVELGYQVLAISADGPRKVQETQEKSDFNYRLLSDSKMQAARAFGIAFRVDDATVEKYRGHGIDLEKASGEKHHLLPVPSVFIVGTDGVIRFAYSNPDYKVRLEPEKVLAAAKRAME
jgi:peroxiredoxin